MCGIAGLIRYDGLSPADVTRAQQLRSRLRHRGPDDAGISTAGNAVLVQTRLSLVAPERYPLPLQTPDGRYTLLYNGEIYNHLALRPQLIPDYDFQTRTDTEVFFAALLKWGAAAFQHMEGMYSFFLWDSYLQTGLAGVDPLSVKPFLYHASATQFAFCSEAAPLLESGILPFRPHDESIAEYLTAPYFSSTLTLPFANLERLPAGHYLELTGGRVRTVRYAANSPEPQALLPALRRAVRSQFQADAEVGMFLSGGVDSSLIAALAPEPVHSFTIQYPHRPEDFTDSLIVRTDDVPFARQVAAQFGHPHHIVTPEDFEAALQRTLHDNDLIAAWEQEVSQNLLAEAAAPYVKAVLVGDAADETHFGYSFLLHPDRLASPRNLIDFFGALPTRIPSEHFVDKYLACTRAEGHNWDSLDARRLAVTSLIRGRWLTRLLHNGDIHLMAHGVEGRVPFADSTLLAIAAQLTPEIALRDGIEKHHLRTAAAEVLPASIAWRPKSALTKHLGARTVIHALFRQAWQRHGALIEPYICPDFVESLGPPENDRQSGIRFRLLALLTWLARFSQAGAG